jgi:hypothetical protein
MNMSSTYEISEAVSLSVPYYSLLKLEMPTPSAYGETLVVTNSHGNIVTTTIVDSNSVTIELDNYIDIEQRSTPNWNAASTNSPMGTAFQVSIDSLWSELSEYR